MKLSDINIRDPYILPHEGRYYLYGTRSATCWGPADGFDCYVSGDLEEWEGPFEVFHRPDGFWADRSYWAPECYYYRGEFCLIATLGSEARGKSVNLLKADSPLGPFRHVAALTPPGAQAIDGTLYQEDGAPWLIYSHSFENGGSGEMYAVRLTEDLERMDGSPMVLFSAPDAPWARPVPWAREEFGLEGDIYFTDGPALHRLSGGGLAMLWSSWGERGYAVGLALSPTGRLSGPWEHRAEPLFPENGGHGMLFTRFDGEMEYLLHYPNDKYRERPIRRGVEEGAGVLRLKG